jgi:factor associated with neutral sphingomyelinase activation
VIQDYSSDELDFTNERIYRDFKKPMGAQDEERLDMYKQRYFESVRLDCEDPSEQPSMYLTHYSSSGIVMYYLIRKFPAYILRLANADFGPKDRMFFNLEMTFSYNLTVLSDVKELIP